MDFNEIMLDIQEIVELGDEEGNEFRLWALLWHLNINEN